MRKITKLAVNAFIAGRSFKSGNTEVTVENGQSCLKLHGNVIARYSDADGLFITDAGWQTNTTKERLNGILGVNIQQKNWVWYLNGKKWDGRLTKIR